MKKINPHIIFVTFIFILSLFFLKSILHKGVIFDNIHYINDLTFQSYNVKESLKNKEFALWTPYFYAGHPLLAIPEYYMLDLNFLLIYLSKSIYLAMNLAAILYFFLAGLGMYLLINNLVNSKKAAFISAVVYMLNGFMHSFIISGHINILEGYALIPFIFLFTHKALKGREWVFYSILAGILFALQILSGSMIIFFYTAFIILAYLAFNLISKNFAGILMKSVFIGVIMAAIALSLASIKLLPVIEFTKMSSRAVNVSFNEFLGQPIELHDIARVAITNIGYYGMSAAIGITGFILMIYGFFCCKKRIIVFSIFLVLFSLLFASGTFAADLMYKTPGFNRMRHAERALVLFAFAGPILAAYGFILLSDKLKKYPVYLKYENLFFAGIVFLILLELLFLQNVPSSTKIIEPKDIELLDYVSDDNSIFRTINLAQKDIIGAAGYNYYAQEGISEVKGGGGIWVNDYVGFVAIAQQALNAKIFSILNVKYIVSEGKLEASNITLVGKFDECKECAMRNAFGPYLYRNELFLPRYFIVPKSILVLGDSNMVKQLINGMVFQNLEPEDAVLVEGTKINDYGIDFLKKFSAIILLKDSIDQNSLNKLKEYAASGGKIVPDILNGQNSISNGDISALFNSTKQGYTEIDIKEYSNNKVALGLNGEKGWLVASERFAHFPGWRASINGNELKMFKADSAISALYLDGLKGELVFEYSPYSYKKGKYISILALLIIIIYTGHFIYSRTTK